MFDFTYDAANRLTFRNNRQAVGTAFTYNSAGLVTFILSNQNQGAGGTLNTDTYTYDPAGNRMTSDSYDGHTFYAYDAADQITGENHNTGYPSFTATYDYDRNGNRLHKTQNGQTDTYTYQPNAYNSQTHTDELQSVSGGITGTKTFGYDANGVARSITTNGSTLYLTADTEDRYTRFDFDTGPGSGRVNAYETYNGMGLRVFRHDAQGRDFPLAYDGASPGSALLSSAGTSFTPGLAQQDSNGQHFYQVDALGSVRGVSDNAQNPQGEVYYDAFGLPSLRQGSTPSPLGFAGAAGYQTDADTGLMLLGNRYYDASIGRFLSPDPAGAGDNWYEYCDNNPTGGVDPEGLMGVPTPTGASFGNPLGQMESFLSSIGVGHWTHGAPVRYSSNGTPIAHTADGDEWQTTQWVPDFGDAVDNFATFGLVGKAGTAMGMADSGRGSRGKAIGLTMAAIGAGIAFAGSQGRDAIEAHAAEESTALVPVITPELKILGQKALRNNSLLQNFTAQERELLAQYYVETALKVKGSAADAARLFNFARAGFFRGQINAIAHPIQRFLSGL